MNRHVIREQTCIYLTGKVQYAHCLYRQEGIFQGIIIADYSEIRAF